MGKEGLGYTGGEAKPADAPLEEAVKLAEKKEDHSTLDLNQGAKSGKYSNLKIAWHPEKLQSFAKGTVTPPIYVRVKPTNLCNHGCFYCVYEVAASGIHEAMEHRDRIPDQKMDEILGDFHEMGIKAVTYTGGGEPLMYPYIKQTLKKTLDYGIKLSMITNGSLLWRENAELLSQAEWVRISIDYTDPETFFKIRRVDRKHFTQVTDNVAKFAKMKKPSCGLGVNYVVNEHNFDKLYEGARFLRDIGIDNVRFSPMWRVGDFEQYHAKIKDVAIEQIRRAREEFSRPDFEISDAYKKDFEFAGKNHRVYTKCYIMQIIPVIGADQGVYFCHNKAYSQDGTYGSIKDQSFKQLWFSDETKRIMDTFNAQQGCKHECANDIKNIFINEMMNASDPHVADFP